jgi:hypothetical protein
VGDNGGGQEKEIKERLNIAFHFNGLARSATLWSSGQSSWLHNGDVLCFL